MPLDEDWINRYEEPSEMDAYTDTTDVQGNNIDSKFRTEATKTILSGWTYLIRKLLKDWK
jgi:hypothetical protein